eukprot:scaffold99569_cov31-Prasinocladus_malaysianus.AAC.1
MTVSLFARQCGPYPLVTNPDVVDSVVQERLAVQRDLGHVQVAPRNIAPTGREERAAEGLRRQPVYEGRRQQWPAVLVHAKRRPVETWIFSHDR